MARLHDVWLCAQDLQLIRADRVISLLITLGPGYGAEPPGDESSAVGLYAEIVGGLHGDIATGIKLADCDKRGGQALLGQLAQVISMAAQSDGTSGEHCVFVFAERDSQNHMRWTAATQLPSNWPSHPTVTPPEAIGLRELGGPPSRFRRSGVP